MAAVDLGAGEALSRVTVRHRGAYTICGPDGLSAAALSETMRSGARSALDYPTVGDWVTHTVTARHDRRLAITGLMPRSSLVCRRAPGPRSEPQAVAANVDCLAIVVTAEAALAGATGQLGASVERYLVAAASGRVQPVVTVNKADLVDDDGLRAVLGALSERLAGATDPVPMIVTSALDGRGLDELAALAIGGATLAFGGASGVGKSSLVNRLVGADVQATAEVDPSGRGRHTTVRRELFAVGGPDGGTVVDTPGLGDLVPWGGDLRLVRSAQVQATGRDGLARVFADIERLTPHCRFVDCAHRAEPNCAVTAAVHDGLLAPQRLADYCRLAAELDDRPADID